MKLRDILTEGVEVHGKELLAYVITIAEIYAEKPKLEKDAVKNWDALISFDYKIAEKALGGLKVEYTTEDPYSNINDLIADMFLNKRLKVYKTPDSKHPKMSEYENDLFRAIHDAMTHGGANLKPFEKFLQNAPKAKIQDFDPVWGNSFTVRGEMNTYVKHAKIAPKLARPALFTEIVGQICTYFVTGDYTDDKVAILDGVDFKNVGVLMGKRKARMEEILAQINDDSVDSIKTKVEGKVLKKNKIRWKLLSKGTGAGNIT